jgi:hypothetical protein
MSKMLTKKHYPFFNDENSLACLNNSLNVAAARLLCLNLSCKWVQVPGAEQMIVQLTLGY